MEVNQEVRCFICDKLCKNATKLINHLELHLSVASNQARQQNTPPPRAVIPFPDPLQLTLAPPFQPSQSLGPPSAPQNNQVARHNDHEENGVSTTLTLSPPFQ
ncbi:hypothetical protein OSB04_000900 [Centaurea solstitialis]|uniref:C2H2-type domain-containing protein n=1 Tax=Centaurea solstitialis TaxID=347529 RepID=A0AA38WU49_9ASTR|nr:hypothetical protein OSB04_000900 [Centaurea solstitialis]